MRKLITLTLVALLSFAGLSYAQEKTLKEHVTQQMEIDLHGPTLELPWVSEGGSRAIGDDCITPIIIGAFPYTDVNTTVGRGNNYDATCMGSYDGGEDIIYQFTLTTTQMVTASLNPGPTTYTGIGIMDACPMLGTCLGISTNGSATPHAASALLTPGTYYIMIDTWPAPANIPSFTLNVTLSAPPANFPAYGFMASAGTYTEISGGIELGTETSDDQYFVDPAVPAGASVTTGPGFDIGFPFVFNTTTFDRLGINANGWIALGNSTLTPSVNLQSASAYTPLSAASTAAPADLRSRIAAFGRDLGAQPGSSIRHETIGTAPNRVCVVQFKNYRRYAGTDDVLNFQIRLYETTNEVKIVYGTNTTTNTTAIVSQVGLGGSIPSIYLNRTATTSWDVTTAGTSNAATMTFSDLVVPASGLTYTFAPMAPLAAQYSSPANGASGMPTNVSINWAPNTSGGGAPDGYLVYMGTDVPPTNVANGIDVGNVLAYTPAAPLNTATLYNWQVVPYNSIGNATGNATWSFTTTAGIGTLEGYTTSGFGIPLGGVNVSLFNGLTSISTVSAPNGFYQFALISAGDYQLTASLPTYNNTVLMVNVAPATTTYQNVAMLRPAMAVTPNPYSLSANPNEMVDGALNVANNGDGVLGWSASISYTSPGPNSWLTLGQSSGTVVAYGNFNAPLAFNAAGLTAGTVKTAEITFTSTPDVGTVVVPVTMTVSGVELGVPFDLEATITNPISGDVSLSWSFEATRAFQFFIIKRDGVQVGTTANNVYTETLPAYGVYSYTVQAVYDEGNSAPAGPVVIEWSNPTLVLNPTSLYNEQYPSSQETVFMRISNTGLGTLAYSFPEYETTTSRAPLAYCAASGGCDEYIGTVQFGTINNTSGCGGYTDFTSISTELVKGETYPITVTNPTPYSTDITGVWIDWNKNELFDDAGEFFSTASAGGATFTANITVPGDALTGATRMRVRLQYGGTLAPCGTTSYGEVEDYTVIVANPTFIVAVAPAAGQVAAGSFVDVAVTFSSNEWPVGTHNTQLELNTNDLANEVVMIPATMVVYNPGMISGNVTSAVDGSPIHGAVVTAGSYSATTNEDGNYSMIVDAGTYEMTFSKTGFTSEMVAGVVVTETNTTVVDAELEEVFYSPTLVNAVVNDEDTATEVTWGVPEPSYEALYDDGTAENFAAWALPGNMNAVKFTPAGYPATVYGGRVFVGDGSFPNNNTGFIGTTFGAMVKAADGTNGMPGTTLDSISVTVNNLGWVDFTGLNASVTEGSFYLVMVQGALSPNCAPVGIDQDIPTVYRSYSRNVSSGGAWGLSPYQDMMIRAFMSGPIASDDAIASTVTRSPLKQRGLISQSPATAQSGVEGKGRFLAIQDGASNRDVTSYKIWRVSGFDPNGGPEAGTLTLLSGTVANTNYTDAAYGPLPQGWYAYAVAANYTNGGESPKVFSNIVGHKLLVTVTCNVSLTTGGSPAGATVGLYGQDYPYAVYFETVPEDGTVIFENVWKGNYTLEALKVGFDDYVLTPNITSNRTFNILLLERKYKPRNLYVDGLTLVATWDEPLAIAVGEDFEGATFPPAGWQALTQNTTGWYATTNGSSSSWAIPSHTKYAVTNDDADNGDGCCDYLITPEMDWTNLPSYRMNFSSFYDGAYSQSAYVELSTDAGATWTVINTLSPATSWQDLEIDLTQYSGVNGLASVWIAFHADDNGAWASGWAVDDVVIQSGGVPLQGYGVFLDGTLVDNTPERTFTYTNLNYGQSYLAGVAALFSSGYSELDTYRFTSVYLIPPTNLQGESPAMTDYVNLSWLAPVVPTQVMSTPGLTPEVAFANSENDVNATPRIVAPGREIWDIQFNFDIDGPSGLTGLAGAESDGEFIYATKWAGSEIVKFDMDGTFISTFTIPGVSGLRDLAFDGTYMYGAAGATTVWKMDFSNQTLVSSFTAPTAVRAIAYDSDADAFWGNNWDTDMVLFDETGATLDVLTGMPSLYGAAYDSYSAGGPFLWFFTGTTTGGGCQLEQYDLAAQGLTGVSHSVSADFGDYIAGGLYITTNLVTGKVTIGGTAQGTPDIAFGYELADYSGGGGGQTVANLLGYNIYRDSEMTAYVEKPAITYSDLNLMPGTYSYHITAVYDLTPYGFAGQTGESMIEGPIDVTVAYGYELPFTENFSTGLFETNQWTVDGANWRIAGQVGNEAPSAEFYYSPVTSDYTQSLTSFYMIGSGIIDGNIKIDFDLKNTIVNPTEAEFLAVEVNNGGSWVKVAEYTNGETTDWTTMSVDITNQAKGKVFRVRFTARGANTLDIFNWLVDNVSIYRVCAPPVNLVADVNFPAVDQIILNWEAPTGTGPGPSAWLGWDNGTNDDAIGLTGGGTFSVAARFTPAQLGEYAGTSLTKVRFFPYAAGTFVLKVWLGANASQLVVTQPIASVVVGEWNEIAVSTPVFVTGTDELWIGYTVTHAANDFPAGVDAGPAVAGFGDMISLDGSVWESMATAYALNFNWNLNGFVETIDGVTALQPISDNTVYGPVSQLVRGNLPMSPNATVTNTTANSGRELTGYNVWRDGEFVANTTETTYVDNDSALEIGNTYCYVVTAVYEDCESLPSNEDCELLTATSELEAGAVSVYPNPSNSVVNIELTSDISQIVVYNYVGQVVYEQNVTKSQTIQLNVRNYESGAYLVKFVTRAGESFTKKVVVTK
ncbi:MAG: carboxypeptidase regulatory-like domain-containing protein [Lentimicrobium sp.]